MVNFINGKDRQKNKVLGLIISCAIKESDAVQTSEGENEKTKEGIGEDARFLFLTSVRG